MESISDFWKSARERFTNPLAFAYIVAWFSYNWKITVALFFTDKLPIQYQKVYNFIGDELKGIQFQDYTYFNGIDVWGWPLVIAILYVVVISFMRQVVDWLNVKFNKVGTKWVLNESRGGKVSIEKYIAERDKVLEMTKRLEQLFAAETQKDTAYNNLLTNLKDTNEQLSKSHQNNTTLQTTVNQQQKDLQERQDAINSIHNYSPIRGRWDIRLGNEAATYYEVGITTNNTYIASNELNAETQIINLFYNKVERTILFYRINRNTGKVFVYDLRIQTEHHLEGTENGVPIHFNTKIK